MTQGNKGRYITYGLMLIIATSFLILMLATPAHAAYPSSPYFHYDMEQSNAINDVSGNNRNGWLSVGNSVWNLEGSDHYRVAGNSMPRGYSNIGLTNDYTLVLKLAPNQLLTVAGTQARIISQNMPSYEMFRVYEYYDGTKHQLCWWVYDDASNPYRQIWCYMQPGAHTYSMKMSETGKTMQMYVDGVLQPVSYTMATTHNWQGNYGLQWDYPGENAANGARVYDVGFWQRALTQTELDDLNVWQNTVPPPTTCNITIGLFDNATYNAIPNSVFQLYDMDSQTTSYVSAPTGIITTPMAINHSFTITGNATGYYNSSVTITVRVNGEVPISTGLIKKYVTVPTVIPLPSPCPVPTVQINQSMPTGSINPIDWFWYIADLLNALINWLLQIPGYFLGELIKFFSWAINNILVLISSLIELGNYIINGVMLILQQLQSNYQAFNNGTITNTTMQNINTSWDIVFTSINTSLSPYHQLVNQTLIPLDNQIVWATTNSTAPMVTANNTTAEYNKYVGSAFKRMPSSLVYAICVGLMLGCVRIVWWWDRQ